MADVAEGAVATSRLQQAYQRKFDEMTALERDKLAPVNIDIPSVYTMGSGALAKCRAYREQLISLPFINKAWVEEAEDYLLALGHAQALHIAATTPPASLPELYAQLLSLREILLADSTALQKRGLIPGDKLKELRGPISHSATAFDVLALATILRASWTQIQGKTALTLAEIERAESLSDQLLSAVGERAATEEQIGAATVNRRRAFTLFVRAYDEVRRGLVYLRWHEGDADELAPSLYSTRVGRRRRSGSASEEADVSEVRPEPAPANGSATATVASHPDGSPFVS